MEKRLNMSKLRAEVWRDAISISIFADDDKASKRLLVGKTEFIRVIEGEDWTEIMKKHHVLMGWEPYEPFDKT
jgi:hypothetical protein